MTPLSRKSACPVMPDVARQSDAPPEPKLLTLRVVLDDQTHSILDCLVEDDGMAIGRLPIFDARFNAAVDGTAAWTVSMHGIHVDFERTTL